MPLVTAENLLKKKGGEVLVEKFSLAVDEKETFVLNGSPLERTAALRCIASIDDFDTGRVKVANVTIDAAMKGREKRVASEAIRKMAVYVSPSFRLFPHMPVIDNIMIGPKFALRESSAAARADAMRCMYKASLVDIAKRMPGSLTKGETRRAVIARAIAVRPRVLLLDDPTLGLTRDEKGGIISLIDELIRDALTMIIATRDEELINNISKAKGVNEDE